MTPEEQRRGETLDERLAREEPERGDHARSTAAPGQLVDEGVEDTEKDLVGEMAEGRLDVDDEDDLLEDVGSAGDDELPMEEAAMRIADAAPGGTDDASDGYVLNEEDR